MTKVKGFKKRTEPRFDAPGSQNSRSKPTVAPVSGGEDANSTHSKRGEHPFTKAVRKREKQAVEYVAGLPVVELSGSDKPLETIKANPISKYKKAAGAKFGTVAAHNPALFNREAAKPGND